MQHKVRAAAHPHEHTSAREVAHLRPGIDPTLGGPGCVEEHHPGGDLVEHLRRKQNHRDDATAFGTSTRAFDGRILSSSRISPDPLP